MASNDQRIKDRLLERLSASPEKLIRDLVAHHKKAEPGLRMAIWLNATEDPWKKGLDLVEILSNVPVDPDPDFHPIEFAPQDGWPRLRIVLTSPGELNLGKKKGSNFTDRVKRALRRGKAKVVFPSTKRPGEQGLDELLGPA